MARMIGDRRSFLQGHRPKTDYERWLEEQNKSYQTAQTAEYHPSISGVENQKPVLSRLSDNIPGAETGSTHPDAIHLRKDGSHGWFIHRLHTRPTAMQGAGAITGISNGRFSYQLVLLLVMIIAILQMFRIFRKRHRTASVDLTCVPVGYIDGKHLV
ncbi:uncharacterized protein BDW43DRAFT_260541 [Aspergillus alliaceus]|uniref:uncharacterized protein n=1 Tax=Petromyces alliaceus TaxID=209559 RepID=UPI0012A3F2DA|nr:uncharacterized protein BDW43DRAFT_260541 [Aspergillus alliaceus]KAB8239088.1 hypothetical protein BDW43DRAFT_260541 [Aspergillus alliaceus]